MKRLLIIRYFNQCPVCLSTNTRMFFDGLGSVCNECGHID